MGGLGCEGGSSREPAASITLVGDGWPFCGGEGRGSRQAPPRPPHSRAHPTLAAGAGVARLISRAPHQTETSSDTKGKEGGRPSQLHLQGCGLTQGPQPPQVSALHG